MKRSNKKAHPLLVGVTRDKDLIDVWCPFCKKYHTHGWDATDPDKQRAEHRCAHCTNESPLYDGGYYIAVAPKRK